MSDSDQFRVDRQRTLAALNAFRRLFAVFLPMVSIWTQQRRNLAEIADLLPIVQAFAAAGIRTERDLAAIIDAIVRREREFQDLRIRSTAIDVAFDGIVELIEASPNGLVAIETLAACLDGVRTPADPPPTAPSAHRSPDLSPSAAIQLSDIVSAFRRASAPLALPPPPGWNAAPAIQHEPPVARTITTTRTYPIGRPPNAAIHLDIDVTGDGPGALVDVWDVIRHHPDPAAYCDASLQMDNMIGHAFAAKNRALWDERLRARLVHNVTLLHPHILPGPASYVSDLCAAIILRERKLARRIALRTIEIYGQLPNTTVSNAVARILASFVLNNHDGTKADAILFADDCKHNTAFSPVLASRYHAWAMAVLALCNDDASSFAGAFSHIASERTKFLKRRLASANRGACMPLSPLELWDNAASALATIAIDHGLRVTSTPYVDIAWLGA